jgi:hypothetical protein
LKAMATILRGVLAQHFSAAKAGETIAERVAQRLLDNALAGDLAAIRFIFEVVDGPEFIMGRPIKALGELADRPAVELIEPDD